MMSFTSRSIRLASLWIFCPKEATSSGRASPVSIISA